jgi:hypothetical protein
LSSDSRGPGCPRCSRRCARRVERFSTSRAGYAPAALTAVLALRALGNPNGVGPGLLQEARAKPARRTVQSERPGLPAGAFALCAVRTAFCDKGLRARRSLGVGQGRGALGALADRCGRLGGLSLGALRDSYEVGCLCLTLTGAFMSLRS